MRADELQSPKGEGEDPFINQTNQIKSNQINKEKKNRTFLTHSLTPIADFIEERGMRGRAVVALWMALWLAAEGAPRQELWVNPRQGTDPSCRDPRDGSGNGETEPRGDGGEPFATIEGALRCSSIGDVVVLEKGEYPGFTLPEGVDLRGTEGETVIKGTMTVGAASTVSHIIVQTQDEIALYINGTNAEEQTSLQDVTLYSTWVHHHHHGGCIATVHHIAGTVRMKQCWVTLQTLQATESAFGVLQTGGTLHLEDSRSILHLFADTGVVAPFRTMDALLEVVGGEISVSRGGEGVAALVVASDGARVMIAAPTELAVEPGADIELVRSADAATVDIRGPILWKGDPHPIAAQGSGTEERGYPTVRFVRDLDDNREWPAVVGDFKSYGVSPPVPYHQEREEPLYQKKREIL